MGGFRPVALRLADANAGGDRLLRSGHAAFELRADFEQHQIVETARLIALRRRQQRRQQAGPQRIEIGGNWVFELPRVVAATEQRRVRARDEGEFDRLVEAARGDGAAHQSACAAAPA